MRVPEFLHPLISFVTPSLCLVCERPVPQGFVVCDGCSENLRRRHGIRDGCFVCGGPLSGRSCPRCRAEEFSFQRARSPFIYRDEIRLLVELFKYTGITRIAEFLGREMAHALPVLGSYDLIVPLPLNRVKERERGFSQTRLLTREIHRVTGVPWNDRVLRRVRNTRSQTGLGRKERKLNVKDAFRAEPSREVEGRTLLLVDDVMTTGATMSSAAKALRKAGAARVLGIAAATAERIQ